MANGAEPASNPIYNPDRVQDPLSPYQLLVGSLIPRTSSSAPILIFQARSSR
jgi:hypothetical protein